MVLGTPKPESSSQRVPGGLQESSQRARRELPEIRESSQSAPRELPKPFDLQVVFYALGHKWGRTLGASDLQMCRRSSK